MSFAVRSFNKVFSKFQQLKSFSSTYTTTTILPSITRSYATTIKKTTTTTTGRDVATPTEENPSNSIDLNFGSWVIANDRPSSDIIMNWLGREGESEGEDEGFELKMENISEFSDNDIDTIMDDIDAFKQEAIQFFDKIKEQQEQFLCQLDLLYHYEQEVSQLFDQTTNTITSIDGSKIGNLVLSIVNVDECVKELRRRCDTRVSMINNKIAEYSRLQKCQCTTDELESRLTSLTKPINYQCVMDMKDGKAFGTIQFEQQQQQDNDVDFLRFFAVDLGSSIASTSGFTIEKNVRLETTVKKDGEAETEDSEDGGDDEEEEEGSTSSEEEDERSGAEDEEPQQQQQELEKTVQARAAAEAYALGFASAGGAIQKEEDDGVENYLRRFVPPFVPTPNLVTVFDVAIDDGDYSKEFTGEYVIPNTGKHYFQLTMDMPNTNSMATIGIKNVRNDNLGWVLIGKYHCFDKENYPRDRAFCEFCNRQGDKVTVNVMVDMDSNKVTYQCRNEEKKAITKSFEATSARDDVRFYLELTKGPITAKMQQTTADIYQSNL